VESCPINAIEMSSEENPRINTSICIGCGVCALNCQTGELKLVELKQRVLHPEDTIERVVLQYLEKGTLQNQMFSNPQSITYEFMRGFVGAFLKLPPVKKGSDGRYPAIFIFRDDEKRSLKIRKKMVVFIYY